jgi:hypothetical protein
MLLVFGLALCAAFGLAFGMVTLLAQEQAAWRSVARTLQVQSAVASLTADTELISSSTRGVLIFARPQRLKKNRHLATG